jgi:hypothetical protein
MRARRELYTVPEPHVISDLDIVVDPAAFIRCKVGADPDIDTAKSGVTAYLSVQWQWKADQAQQLSPDLASQDP